MLSLSVAVLDSLRLFFLFCFRSVCLHHSFWGLIGWPLLCLCMYTSRLASDTDKRTHTYKWIYVLSLNDRTKQRSATLEHRPGQDKWTFLFCLLCSLSASVRTMRIFRRFHAIDFQSQAWLIDAWWSLGSGIPLWLNRFPVSPGGEIIIIIINFIYSALFIRRSQRATG